jgi:hypothetical protein
MLKTIKILTIAPTCFGSRRNHHQGAISCLAKATIMILLCSSLMMWSMLWRHTGLLCKHKVHGRGRHLFKCLWTVLSYLDIFHENWHRYHGLMWSDVDWCKLTWVSWTDVEWYGLMQVDMGIMDWCGLMQVDMGIMDWCGVMWIDASWHGYHGLMWRDVDW